MWAINAFLQRDTFKGFYIACLVTPEYSKSIKMVILYSHLIRNYTGWIFYVLTEAQNPNFKSGPKNRGGTVDY